MNQVTQSEILNTLEEKFLKEKRTTLLKILARCNLDQQSKFWKIFSQYSNIDDMPEDILDQAIDLCERTIRKNRKEFLAIQTNNVLQFCAGQHILTPPQNTPQLPIDMDNACILLCNTLNSVKGIVTTESCSGHGKTPFSIIFKITEPHGIKGLFFVTKCIDGGYPANPWKITISAGDKMKNGILPTLFHLQSKSVGEDAYNQAFDLIVNLNHHLNNKDFIKEFGFQDENFYFKNRNELE